MCTFWKNQIPFFVKNHFNCFVHNNTSFCWFCRFYLTDTCFWLMKHLSLIWPMEFFADHRNRFNSKRFQFLDLGCRHQINLSMLIVLIEIKVSVSFVRKLFNRNSAGRWNFLEFGVPKIILHLLSIHQTNIKKCNCFPIFSSFPVFHGATHSLGHVQKFTPKTHG